MKTRNENRNKIIDRLKSNKKWKDQFHFVPTKDKVTPSWFGLPLIINKAFSKKKKIFLDYLTSKKIENRPILSGNFLNQPASKLYNFKQKPDEFPNSQNIENLGFFIGLHTERISEKTLDHLTTNLLKIDEI